MKWFIHKPPIFKILGKYNRYNYIHPLIKNNITRIIKYLFM